MEIWKEVKGFENYEVSSLGRVKSLARVSLKNAKIKERILKGGKSRGYRTVCLSKNGIPKTKSVHQLVAVAFLNHKPCKMNAVVDHINGVKEDNNVSNLQVVSQRENTSKDKRNGSSRYIGVCWDKWNKRWKASIKINGKLNNLGNFRDELEAAKAYQIALLELVN
tara:strand:- start:326 stop:823 length:498 start_codon:yes stop_codon:yes gene_type:complete